MLLPNGRIALNKSQKFILSYVGNEKIQTPFLWGDPEKWHKDIIQDITNAGFSVVSVAGGGRVKILEDSKTIHLWGTSTKYGDFPKDIVTQILQETFQGYQVSNEQPVDEE